MCTLVHQVCMLVRQVCMLFRQKPTCGSDSSSVQASSTTPGAAKHAKLSMWPAAGKETWSTCGPGGYNTPPAAAAKEGCAAGLTVGVVIPDKALGQPDDLLRHMGECKSKQLGLDGGQMHLQVPSLSHRLTSLSSQL